MKKKHDPLDFKTLPNFLSLLRISAIPVVMAFLFFKEHRWDVGAALVFGAASVTDWLDGYLARKYGLTTIYGKLLDPLADKFLVVAALVMLQYLGRIHPAWVVVMICRELGITGLRALASAEGLIIAARDSAKWKTALQMFGIPFMMVQPGIWGIPLFQIGQVLLGASVVLSLWSAFSYMKEFFSAVRRK